MTPWKRKEVIGGASLYLGDCVDILPELGRFDACVTDPPYGIGESNKNFASRSKLANADKYVKAAWDERPASDYIISFIRRISDHQIIFGGNYFNLPPTSCWLVWDKLNGENDFADCELAWTNLDKAVRRIKWRWAGMLQQDMANKEDRVHPTQKPLEVMRWSLGHVPKAKTILDPFMGSGTTGVAAVKDGRTFVGIEMDESYFDFACDRIRKAYEQPDMFVEAYKPAEQVGMDF